MKRLFACAVVMLMLGCPSNAVPDAGMDAPDVPYDGGTTGGAIPIDPPVDPDEPDDAGDITVDNRCCELWFSIADQEPPDTVGVLAGTYGPVAGDGVPLVRDGGTWSAAACLPVVASTQYWFQLTLLDAGAGDPSVVVRYDENAPTVLGFGGTLVNVFGPVTDCSAVDAGTGTWP